MWCIMMDNYTVIACVHVSCLVWRRNHRFPQGTQNPATSSPAAVINSTSVDGKCSWIMWHFLLTLYPKQWACFQRCCGNKLIVSWIGALSPVNHKGLHQGWKQTTAYLQVIHSTSHTTNLFFLKPQLLILSTTLQPKPQQADSNLSIEQGRERITP